jgi:hypothetical protein
LHLPEKNWVTKAEHNLPFCAWNIQRAPQ